jgi:hypothetical protein
VKMSTFSIDVSYSQLAVFMADLTNPFNDWTDAHVAQGFSWRPGSVSFKTLDETGTLTATVSTDASFDDAISNALRVIRVPFVVTDCGDVEVASPGSATTLPLPPGNYELTFEHGKDEGGIMWCKLYFRRVEALGPARVLRADQELCPSEELIMTAESA